MHCGTFLREALGTRDKDQELKAAWRYFAGDARELAAKATPAVSEGSLPQLLQRACRRIHMYIHTYLCLFI